MAAENLKDNVPQTTLTAGIDSDDTSITVASASGYPDAPFPLHIGFDATDYEIVLVTNKNGGATWDIVRAQYGTTAKAHSSGAVVRAGAPYRMIQNANIVCIAVALSDETSDLTTGTAKATIHLPRAFTVDSVFAEVNTVSSSGVVTVDINEGAGAGTSILSTKLTIDASEETSDTAATAAVISDSTLAQFARLTFDIDTAGTGAKGLKVWLIGRWT